MLDRSLPMKSTTSLGCDEFNTYTTNAAFVHDVTDTNHWAQYGSTHGRVLATFNVDFMANRTRDRVKLCCALVFYFIPIDKARSSSSLRVPFSE